MARPKKRQRDPDTGRPLDDAVAVIEIPLDMQQSDVVEAFIKDVNDICEKWMYSGRRNDRLRERTLRFLVESA